MTLLQKYLAWYDPIHRGWTLAGIANGVCATNGFGFPRIRGGYNLRRTGEGQAGAELVGAAGADAASVRTFGWVVHEAGAKYTYRLAAVGGGGAENLLEESEAPVAFDGQGHWPGPRPNRPSDLRATPASGGRFVLKWVYSPDGQQVEPEQFRIYRGLGWSGVDYENPVATVPHQSGRLHASWTSGPLADGTRVCWAVRAVSPAGVEDDNDIVVAGWADAAAPAINPTVVVRCV